LLIRSSKCSINILEAKAIASSGFIEPLVQTSRTNLSYVETSIEDLDFSVRAYNCLKRAGIHTLQDLVNKSESDMMKILASSGFIEPLVQTSRTNLSYVSS